jgi:hypothetical protein
MPFPAPLRMGRPHGSRPSAADPPSHVSSRPPFPQLAEKILLNGNVKVLQGPRQCGTSAFAGQAEKCWNRAASAPPSYFLGSLGDRVPQNSRKTRLAAWLSRQRYAIRRFNAGGITMPRPQTCGTRHTTGGDRWIRPGAKTRKDDPPGLAKLSEPRQSGAIRGRA